MDWQGAIAQLGERVVRNDEVGGSIPPGSTILRSFGASDGLRHGLVNNGALAQLGERVLCKHEVIGSIPIGSTILCPSGFGWLTP